MLGNKKWVILCFTIFPLLVSLACTCGLLPFGKNAETSEEEIVVQEPELIITQEINTEEITIEEPPIDEITVEEPSEETVESEPTVILPGEELLLTQLNWFQEDRDVFVTFYLKNQLPNKNLEEIEYTIVLLDANGAEVNTQWNTFPWLFSKETIGIAYRAFLPEDSPPVDSVTLEYNYGEESPSNEFTNPFTVDKLKSWENDSQLVLTGLVTNNSSLIYTDVRINFIYYNMMDEVVGGGYTYVDFVPGNEGMGFNTLPYTYGEVTRVEAYPIITYNSDTFEDTPEFWQSISVLDHAYNPNQFGDPVGGLVIQNNLETLMEWPIAMVTFIDTEGYVTTYGSQEIPYLFPGDTLGIDPFIYAQPQDANSVDYQILVLPGQPVEDYELTENVFRVDSATFSGESDVYALISYTNTYNKSASEVTVYLLAYDMNGIIIGGAKTNVTEPIPAGSSTETEIYVYYNREFTVADIQAWVLPNSWTKFE